MYTILLEKNILIIKIYSSEVYRSLNSIMLTELFFSNLYILDNSCFLTRSMSIARFGCGWLSEVGMVLVWVLVRHADVMECYLFLFSPKQLSQTLAEF